MVGGPEVSENSSFVPTFVPTKEYIDYMAERHGVEPENLKQLIEKEGQEAFFSFIRELEEPLLKREAEESGGCA